MQHKYKQKQKKILKSIQEQPGIILKIKFKN